MDNYENVPGKLFPAAVMAAGGAGRGGTAEHLVIHTHSASVITPCMAISKHCHFVAVRAIGLLTGPANTSPRVMLSTAHPPAGGMQFQILQINCSMHVFTETYTTATSTSCVRLCLHPVQ